MKKRLTFFTAGEDTFLRDIIVNLRKDYDIKFFQKGDVNEFHQLMHDTDVAWIEWCDSLAVYAAQSPSMCPIICRLHSYEMFTELPSKVDWNRITKLVFVSKVVHDYVMGKFKIRPDIATIINNGVNIDKFKIPANKKYNKRVVYSGYLNYKKGPALLLQVFKKIYDHDPSFEFFIAGEHQDARIHLYYQSMELRMPFKINFSGWVQDMPKYLEDKDYIISTSLFESFQYSIAEGMAQGLIPLVHHWLGSDEIYPKDNLFLYPEECVDIIKKFESEKDKNAIRNTMRKHIVDNYSFDKQIKSIRELIESV